MQLYSYDRALLKAANLATHLVFWNAPSSGVVDITSSCKSSNIRKMSFLQEYPALQPFVLANIRPTGRLIGSGSYGSVEEVEMPGTTCAAKKIHDFFQDPNRVSREWREKTLREFVRECGLMSSLRHPHIVQFLGVCLLPGSQIPALVMERLETSLHDVLDPEPPSPTKAFIPLSLKCSILHDVASGLCFLHSHSPPIIHRDLSARNVLLTKAMVAKISDLGMARIVPSLRAATMTKAPGASIYMPPEALENESKYDVTIDVFSFGVLAIFALSQTFPKPLAAAYMNTRRVMVGRTELERRDSYMQQIKGQLQEDNPLIKMIQGCLSNFPRERPKVDAVIQFVREARAETDDRDYDVNKLALIQSLRQRMQIIQEKTKVIKTQNEKIKVLNDTVFQQTKTSTTQPKSLQWPISLQWRRGKDPIYHMEGTTSAVTIDGAVYYGGSLRSAHRMYQYTPDSDTWNQLPEPPVREFFTTSLNGKLVLAGGGDYNGYDVDKITVWDSRTRRWTNPYPPMPTARSQAAAVGYKKYLVVACGFPGLPTVNVLDSSSGRWYTAQPLPVGTRQMSAALVGDYWYLTSSRGWKDLRYHIFGAHLPTLIDNALLSKGETAPIWQELSLVPYDSLASFKGHLLAVGRAIVYYDKEENKWKEYEKLPFTGWKSVCCAELQSGGGGLMLAGSRLYIGTHS